MGCPEADGLPGDFVRTLRLRRWVFELGGWMECRQEGVVLHQQEDGVQGEAWRLSIPRPMLDTTTACTFWWSLGLHRRSTSTRVVRARSRSEQAAGVRSRIEAARDMYVHD